MKRAIITMIWLIVSVVGLTVKGETFGDFEQKQDPAVHHQIHSLQSDANSHITALAREERSRRKVMIEPGNHPNEYEKLSVTGSHNNYSNEEVKTHRQGINLYTRDYSQKANNLITSGGYSCLKEITTVKKNNHRAGPDRDLCDFPKTLTNNKTLTSRCSTRWCGF